MELQSFDLRDPAHLIDEIAAREPLQEDTAYLALVQHPSTTQRLVAVKRLDLPALLDDGEDISDDLCRAARSFGIGWHGRPEHMVMTVLVRPGRCVIGPNELVWSNGWRYSNHLESLFTGDLMLVTEHGWVDFMSKEAGHEPRMQVA